MSKTTQKLDQLTTTRFIAALSVVLFHGGHKLDAFYYYFQIFMAGPTAVSYFFVLSGFVMALVYYRPGVAFNFRNYWLARFSRIYPVYILALILTSLHYPNMLAKAKPSTIWANIFLYQAWIPDYALLFNSAAWSLSVEVFFYLLLPVLIFWVMRLSLKQVIWFSVGFWVVSQVVHSLLTIRFAATTQDWLPYFPLFHINQFLLGLAGGIWFLTNSTRLRINQSVNRIYFITALGTLLLLLSLRAYLSTFPHSFSLDTGLLAPLFLMIVLTLAMDNSGLSKLLSQPGLVLLGDASYALYILHIPIAWLFNWFVTLMGIKLTPEVALFTYVFVSIGLSILVFKYIERPVQNWLRNNPQTLMKILLDVSLILAMIWVSFTLRTGIGNPDVLQTGYFLLRAGVIIFFLTLVIFRFYTTDSWYALLFALIAGTTLLSGATYYAWDSGRVEVFPRSIILTIPLLIFVAIYASRYILKTFKGSKKEAVT